MPFQLANANKGDSNDDARSIASDTTEVIDLEISQPKAKIARKEANVSSSVSESSAHLLLSLSSGPTSVAALVNPSSSSSSSSLSSSLAAPRPPPPPPPPPQPQFILPSSYRNALINACFEGTSKELFPIRPAYTDLFYKHRNKVRTSDFESYGAWQGSSFIFVVGDQVEMPSGYIFHVEGRFCIEGIQWYKIVRKFPDAPSFMVTDESELSLYVVGMTRQRIRKPRVVA